MLPAQPSQKVHLIVPDEFVGGAKEVGDRFKAQSPVILNLAGCDRVVARRLLDYASGLTYGLSGNIKKVGDAVFLLTPKGVEVSAEDKRRYRDTGLFLDEE
jgi:cell division inhibitor SepF